MLGAMGGGRSINKLSPSTTPSIDICLKSFPTKINIPANATEIEHNSYRL